MKNDPAGLLQHFSAVIKAKFSADINQKFINLMFKSEKYSAGTDK
jgi:hypothetical protein